MKRDLISINDLSRSDIERYLAQAAAIEAVPRREKMDILRGYILLEMFFEPSTRTKLSFEAAMRRLGGDVMGFSDVSTTSVKKGESFLDTIHTVAYKGMDVIPRLTADEPTQLWVAAR